MHGGLASYLPPREGADQGRRFLGLDLEELIAWASELAQAPPTIRQAAAAEKNNSATASTAEVPPVEVVFDFFLLPCEEESTAS